MAGSNGDRRAARVGAGGVSADARGGAAAGGAVRRTVRVTGDAFCFATGGVVTRFFAPAFALAFVPDFTPVFARADALGFARVAALAFARVGRAVARFFRAAMLA
ncbi:MAG TPA: hypothetical protein PLX31_17375, partial [Gemmatimonadaceae bacterium]|nr:hypothetical protein [Gemmatimonadaceae bacterium]